MFLSTRLITFFAAGCFTAGAFCQAYEADGQPVKDPASHPAETCLTQADHAELQRLRGIVELMADELQMRERLEQQLRERGDCASNGFVDDLILVLPEGFATSEPFVPGNAASANRAIVTMLNDIDYLGNGPLCSGDCPEENEVCAPTSLTSSSLDDFTLSLQSVVGGSRYVLRDNDPMASSLTIKADCECIENGLVEQSEG